MISKEILKEMYSTYMSAKESNSEVEMQTCNSTKEDAAYDDEDKLV